MNVKPVRPRVLFIVPPYVVNNIDVNRPKIRSYLAFPYGLLSIATYCKRYADIKIIDCDTEQHPSLKVAEVIREFNPHIVGLSMMFDNSFSELGWLLKKIKMEAPKSMIIMGGAAASYSYQEVLERFEEVTAVCFAEGELPMADLLKTCTFRHPAWATRGRTFNAEEELNVIPEADFIEYLDDVIALDYNYINPFDYDVQEAFSPFARSNRRCFFLMTSRGCFGNCAFCSNTRIHGRRVRQASVDAIIDHVKHLVSRYGMDTLVIYDDQLLYRPDRAKELFKRLAQFNIRIEAPNGVSVRFIDEEMAELMRYAGMDTVYLAVESGSQYVLRNLIDKPLELSMVAPAVRALRKVDMFIHAFIVLGMPGETIQHRYETWNFLLENEFDWAGINLATPTRGSRLYDDCIKNGWIKEINIEEAVDKKYIIEQPDIEREEVIRTAHEMNLNVNFHNNYRMKVGDYETAAKCFEQVLQRYEGHDVAKSYLEICRRKLAG